MDDRDGCHCLRLPVKSTSDENQKLMDSHKEASKIFTKFLSEKGAIACQPTMENFRAGGRLNSPTEFTPEAIAQEKQQIKLLLRIAYIRFCSWISHFTPKLNVFSEANDPRFYKLILAKGFQSILIQGLMYYDIQLEAFKIPIDDSHRIKITKQSIEKIFNMDLSPFEALYRFMPGDGLSVGHRDFWRFNPEFRSVLTAAFFFDGSNVEGVGDDFFVTPRTQSKALLQSLLIESKATEVLQLLDALSKTRDSVMDQIKTFLSDDEYLKHIFKSR